MNKKSLTLYIATICLNLLLFSVVFYSYGFLIPVHILIYYLSFKSILGYKSFISDWSCWKFIGIAFIIQWVFIIAILAIVGVTIIDFLSGPLFLFAVVTTGLEVIVLYIAYAKYLGK
jgi:hypothetical protein